MKQFILHLFVLTATACFAQDAITVDSRVSAATVFRDRAMITREGKTKLSKGVQKIVFPGITNTLSNESVRISAEGKGVIKILDVNVESKVSLESPEEKKRILDQRIDSAKQELAILSDEGSVLTKRKEMLELFKAQAIKNLNEKLSNGAGQTSEWAELQKYFDTNLTEIVTAQRRNSQKLSEVQDLLLVLNKEKAQIGGPTKKSSKEIYVSVECSEAGKFTFHPSYIVNEASWYPSYDMRLSSPEKKGDLHLFGMVQQATGEDWNNVSITFSNAEPLSLKNVEKLSPWYLANRRYQMYESNNAAHDKNAAENGSLSTSFTAPETYDIPSDNNSHKVEVSVYSLPMNYAYTTIPKISPAVYLNGITTNSGDSPWLAGDVNVFIDNNYVNRTVLNDILPQDTLALSLGTDNSLHVERVLVNKFRESNGLFSKSVTLTLEYEIRITNNRKTEETVSVFDQIPTRLDEDILVTAIEPKVDSKTPPPNNGISWVVNLKPGEKRVVPIKFSVEYPANKTLYGLE